MAVKPDPRALVIVPRRLLMVPAPDRLPSPIFFTVSDAAPEVPRRTRAVPAGFTCATGATPVPINVVVPIAAPLVALPLTNVEVTLVDDAPRIVGVNT